MSGNEMNGTDPLGAGEFQEQSQDAGLGDEQITPDEASGATPPDAVDGDGGDDDDSDGD